MSDNPEQQNAEPTIATRYVYRYHNDSVFILNLLLLGLVALIGLLVFLIVVQLGTVPRPLYFALNNNGEIIEKVPLNEEGITTPALLNWVNEFTIKAFSFNYSNISQQRAKMAPYFSSNALKLYANLLNNDEDFRTLDEKQYVVSIIPKSAPEILVGKSFQDRYAWQIRVVADIVFSNALEKGSHEVELDYLIWRVEDPLYPLGVNVASFTRTITGRTGAQNVRF